MPTPNALILPLVAALASASEPVTCGYRTISVEVPGRTPVTTAVWYPARTAESAFIYGSANGGQIVGSVAHQAAALAGSWPVIVFSHGFSGGGIGQPELTEALARGGYVVVAPDHADAVLCARIGSTATGTLTEALDHLTAHPIDAETYAYRIAEITAVAEEMRHHPELGIDMRHLVLAGHSMGGWTVVNARIDGLSPTALVSFSMGELSWLYNAARYFEAPVFQDMAFPTLYLYGSREHDAAVAYGRGDVYAAFAQLHSPAPSDLVEIAGGNHFVYNTPAVGGSSAGTAQQLSFISATTLQFLDRNLNIPPANLSVPGVIGRNLAGQTLAANPGCWDDAETPVDGLVFTYQWWRADDSSGANPLQIGGAVGSIYTVQGDDAGKSLRVVISATDEGFRLAGPATATAVSAWLGSGASAAVPAVTSPLSARATVGIPFSYQITASDNPLIYGVGTLAPGLAVDPATGLITGIPTAVGVCNLVLRAGNAAGTGSATLVLTVQTADGGSDGSRGTTGGGGGCGLGGMAGILAGALALVGLRPPQRRSRRACPPSPERP